MKRALMILLLLLLSVSTIAYSEEALFPACDRNGKWGYINTQGERVVKYQWDDALAFSGGYACVKKGGKWGMHIVKKDGKWTFADSEDNWSPKTDRY